MVLEVAILNLRPGKSPAFERAFAEAQRILASVSGYQGHELRHCVEAADRYLLPVWWDDLESHTEGFRPSREDQQWREMLHHFYGPFPAVEHYLPVGGASSV